MPTKKIDPVLIAVLANREQSRLSSQVKTLEKLLYAPFCEKEHQCLVSMAASWRELLAYDDGAPKMVEALDAFIAAYQKQSHDLEALHAEVVFQTGVYRMGHWALVKQFIPGVTACLDNFGGVLPKHRDAFKRQHESGRNLTVEEQSQLLKVQYALITNRRDPYRHEALKRRGLITAGGIVPMGVRQHWS